MKSSAVVLAAALALGACGGKPPVPTRGVVEADIGDWHYRRYQSILDIEVWVDGNPAESYAATYVAAAAERIGRIADDDLVNAVVTRYLRPDGVLRELVRFARRLGGDGGYQVDEANIGGVRVMLAEGRGEAWALWAAGNHVIKVGGRGRDAVPENLIESYGERYPSDVPGGVMEGPLPPGPDPTVAPPVDYDPNNPTPDYDGGDE